MTHTLGKPSARRSRAAKAAPAAPRTSRIRWDLILLVLAVLATFWPVCAHEFTGWDDGLNVTHNPHLYDRTAHGLATFWAHAYQHEYIPLSYSAWWLLAGIAKIDMPDGSGVQFNPYVFHTVNLLLHLAVCLLVLRLLHQLTGARWKAWAGAMVFALHPTQVEPVAWVTGLKDLLCGCFAVLALVEYVAFARRMSEIDKPRDDARDVGPSRRVRAWHYAAALAAFAAAMLAKPSAVSLPLMVVALDLWVLRRPWRCVLASVWPWVALAAAFTLVGVLVQPITGIETAPLSMRPLVAAHSLAFYVMKFLIPIGLTPAYPQSIGSVLAGRGIWAAWLVPVALAALAFAMRRRAIWVAAAVTLFVAGPLPVLGLIPFEFQHTSTVADRYLYLGLLGPALAMSLLLASPRPAAWVRRHRVFAISSGAGVFLGLGALSFAQTAVWRDDTTLFTRVVQTNPTSDVGYTNLAAVALGEGQPKRAAELARRAIELNPNQIHAHLNLGFALQLLDRHAEAGVEFLSAVRIDPGNVQAVTDLAIELANAGHRDRAMELALGARAQWPQEAATHRCLAELYLAGHQDALALNEARDAVALDPADEASRSILQEAIRRAGASQLPVR